MDLGFWAEELQVRSVEEENGDPVKEAGGMRASGKQPGCRCFSGWGAAGAGVDQGGHSECSGGIL